MIIGCLNFMSSKQQSLTVSCHVPLYQIQLEHDQKLDRVVRMRLRSRLQMPGYIQQMIAEGHIIFDLLAPTSTFVSQDIT